MSSHFHKLVKEQCILCISSGNLAQEAEHILICRRQMGGTSPPCWIAAGQWLSLPCASCAGWAGQVPAAGAEPSPALQSLGPLAPAVLLTGALPSVLSAGSSTVIWSHPTQVSWARVMGSFVYLSCSCYKIEVVEDGIGSPSVDSKYLCY